MRGDGRTVSRVHEGAHLHVQKPQDFRGRRSELWCLLKTLEMAKGTVGSTRKAGPPDRKVD